MKRAWVGLAIVFGLALAVRVVAAARVAIIERDGIQYLDAASRFARGDTRAGLEHHYPPAYPFAVAALSRAAGRAPDEKIAQAASALAGAFLALAVAAAATIAFGRRAGLLAGLLACVHPASVEQAAHVLPDALMGALVLLSIVAAVAGLSGRPALFPVAGALAGASYLARPEGVVVLLAILAVVVLARRETRGARGLALRARDAALLLSPALLVAFPYVVSIKKDAALNGGEAGAWKLTKKREIFLEAGGERVFPLRADGSRGLDLGAAAGVAGEWLVHAAKQAALLVVAANPIVLALVVLGASGVRSSRAPPASALAALALAAGGALLFAYAFFRADERYAATLASLSLPFAGLGLSRFASFCERDGFLRGKALVLVLLLAQLPFATRARNERKATWRDAGELVRSLGIARVAASDPRVAFYAGAAHVDLRGALRDAGRSSAERARAVLSLARAANASAIVLDATARDRKPADPIVKEVADLLPSPRVVIPIERRGAESVVVIALSP